VNISVNNLETVSLLPSSGNRDGTELLNVDSLDERVNISILEKGKSLLVKNSKNSLNSQNRSIVSAQIRGFFVIGLVVSHKIDVALFQNT